jgi:4-amino-4-deoxy-L-arabinose transferase-like glycosyltransferase
LTFSRSSRWLLIVPAIFLTGALYLANLTGMGLFGPDEPRYADVGRYMARTGDWVTPHLWGKPWFEKPALLYWMTAMGFDAGLGPDLAPRLPVALLSLAFLLFYWLWLRRSWGAEPASYSTAMLATSAGWLAYSHVAVTDVPLAVFFSAAVLLSLEWIDRGDRRLLPVAAACLGAATLAKGLVPLVLFLPVVAMPAILSGWRRSLDWIRSPQVLAFAVVALPWYALVIARNGWEFIRVFFLQQHFGRFSSTALQHVQPAWFYLPVLLVLLFPWFPLVVTPSIAFPRDLRRDTRVRTLAAVVVFGFVFFTASINKLFGYLIPLLPSLFVLLGVGLARAQRRVWALAAALAFVGALPVAATVAPSLMAPSGGAGVIRGSLASLIVWISAAAVAGLLLTFLAPRLAFGTIASLSAIAFLWFQFAAFPGIDAKGSARSLWINRTPDCVPSRLRNLVYGLYYYSGKELPKCTVLDPAAIRVVR